ncbi:DUF6343 family protein [Streptomyces sp. NPDC102487]|uniref:DUF6343 family protein n=1 Tax=Streptomyces sp. NPDC102487 TaxID=3366182 RepID=UPI0037FEE2AB
MKVQSDRRSGAEPTTARSELKLRFLLSVIFTPLFATAAVAFAFFAARVDDSDPLGPGVLIVLAVLFGLLAVAAAADLVVVLRRRSKI